MSLLTNLVSYWKLDEASGTRNDTHGSNHLTDNNTVTSTSGKINNAAQFANGNSEYLSCTSNSDLQTGDIDFTFTAWIQPQTSFPTGGEIIVGKDVDTPSSSRDYTIDIRDTAAIRFYINGGGTSIVTGPTLSLSTWYFVVAWHDAAANTVNLQVDNGTVNSSSTGGEVPQTSGAEFRIGARAYAGFEGYFNGLIDEVGFWKRTLTTQERSDLYNGGSGLAYSSFNPGDPAIGLIIRNKLRPRIFAPGRAR